jgi:hypothetical protein
VSGVLRAVRRLKLRWTILAVDDEGIREIPIAPEMAETAQCSPRLLRLRSTLDRRNGRHRRTRSGTTTATNSKSSLRCVESSWERMWKGMVRSFPKGRRRKGWRGLWLSAKAAFINPGSGPPIGWKIKARLQQEFVVGGFSEGKGSRQNLGALLLGAYRNGIDLGAQFSQMECSTGATNSRPHNDNSHWLAN